MAQAALTIIGGYFGSFLGPAGSTWGAQLGAAVGANIGPAYWPETTADGPEATHAPSTGNAADKPPLVLP